METVADKTKCESLVKKSEAREEKKRFDAAKLTQEQMAGLELRDDFKTKMFGKTRTEVKELIGEPDSILYAGGNEEHHVYSSKPLTRYSAKHDPDKEIIIIYRRNFVTKVNHVQPDSTPKSDFPFFGDKPPKIEKK
jgi:hypothetical protein